jgi:hypothetical protein
MRLTKTIALCAVLALSIGVATATGGSGGNSSNAKQCYMNGWKLLAGSTGTAFTSQDACVSYAAHGGTLISNAATITINELVNPTNAQDFSFTLTGLSSPQNFSLDDDADATLPSSRTFHVPPGSYTLMQTEIASGWANVGLGCFNNGPGGVSSISLDFPHSTVYLSPVTGDDISCTFTDSQS